MNDTEIFELGLTLAQALNGKQEAIANLKVLFARHPEMFENLEDLRNTIKEVALTPEIIMNNKKPLGSDVEIIAAKRFDDKKMGDIGIRNTGETNVVFHANKTRVSNFERLKKKAEQQKTTTDGRDAQTPYIQAQSLDGRLVQQNTSSVADKDIISQEFSEKHQGLIQARKLFNDKLSTLSEADRQNVLIYEKDLKTILANGDLTQEQQDMVMTNFYNNAGDKIQNGQSLLPKAVGLENITLSNNRQQGDEPEMDR